MSERKPSQRWKAARTALVYVVIGILATLGIAWGSAIFADLSRGTISTRPVPGPGRHSQEMAIDEVCTWTGVRREWHGVDRNKGMDWHDGMLWGPRRGPAPWPVDNELAQWHGAAEWGWYPRTLQEAVSASASVPRIQDARGFPWLCLYCDIDVGMNAAGGTYFETRGGIALSGSGVADALEYRALPLRPLWSGILLDTLAFALTARLALTAPQARSFLRRRRGLCPRCAYDLQGQIAAGCPECGFMRTR